MLQSRAVLENLNSTEQSELPKKTNRSPSPWAYASEGTQLAVVLLAAFYVGYKLDQLKGTTPWFTIGFSFLGMVGGLYNFLRRFLIK